MKIRMAAATDRGRSRTDNQDAFFIDQALGIAMIADGVGGNHGGGVASQMAVASLRNPLKSFIKDQSQDLAECLRSSVIRANELMLEEGLKNRSLRNMATTLDALVIRGYSAYLAHVGDSRVYRRSGEGAWQRVTVDHNIKSMLDLGQDDSQTLAPDLNLNSLTNVLGILECKPEIKILPLSSNTEFFLMCSDGLTNMVTESEIFSIIADINTKNLDNLVQDLIDEANEQGGLDNITVALIKCDPT